MPKKILVFEPHNDDAILGLGGYLIDAIENNCEIWLHTFTIGGVSSNVSEEVRLKEGVNVNTFLGIQHYSYSGIGMDGKLELIPNSELTTMMDKMYDEIEPDEVFCNYKSVHRDHVALYNAFQASLRLRSGFNPKNVYLYEYPFLLAAYEQPNGGKTYYHMSDDTFNKKCKAFELYKSQCKPVPSPLGIVGIKTLAKARGLESANHYAECFYCLKSELKF